MSRVSLQHLVRRFPGAQRPAVDDVSLDLAAGSVTAVVGPSGCGKSTLLRLVAGISAPDAGRVMLDGEDVTAVAPERRGAVMMVQQTLLFPHMSVEANVGFGPRMRGLPRGRVAAEVEAMLARVRLAGFADRRPGELSGGQAQRVALARALVVRPRVLLLDEPLSSLDPELRSDLRAEIAALVRETGTTTLFVTHDREEAVAVGDRIALMMDGRILQEGPPEDLFERPASRAAAVFFGASNLVEGRVEEGAFVSPLGRLALSDPGPSGPATLAIRPEAVALAAPAGPNTLEAVVREAAYRGTHALVVAEAAGIRLSAAVDAVAGRGLRPGETVHLGLPPDRLWRIPEV